jgi:hypothetical protein
MLVLDDHLPCRQVIVAIESLPRKDRPLVRCDERGPNASVPDQVQLHTRGMGQADQGATDRRESVGPLPEAAGGKLHSPP